jgi:hypothetical protein
MAERGIFKERTRPYMNRVVETREPIERFLIVCEGEKTEPNYFNAFRVPKDVVTVIGAGDNTVNIVEKAIEIKKYDDFDQVWCVFDRDSFPAEHFNKAFALAGQHGIKIAYSNEAFELWYLLHFHYFNTGISRASYMSRLNKLLGFPYKKNSSTIYEELLDRQEFAIKAAKSLLKTFNPRNPERDNPSTTVHKLVMELNKFIR